MTLHAVSVGCIRERVARRAPGDRGLCRCPAWRPFVEKRLCDACRRLFEPLQQICHQKFCSAPECQRERRRRWQECKRKSDPDYGVNQRSAQQAWVSRNPGYWREYRRTHPEYCDRNRAQQCVRNRAHAKQNVAKMDAPPPVNALQPGLYRIIPASTSTVAKMNVWIAEITWISAVTAERDERCKERTR